MIPNLFISDFNRIESGRMLAVATIQLRDEQSAVLIQFDATLCRLPDNNSLRLWINGDTTLSPIFYSYLVTELYKRYKATE